MARASCYGSSSEFARRTPSLGLQGQMAVASANRRGGRRPTFPAGWLGGSGLNDEIWAHSDAARAPGKRYFGVYAGPPSGPRRTEVIGDRARPQAHLVGPEPGPEGAPAQAGHLHGLLDGSIQRIPGSTAGPRAPVNFEASAPAHFVDCVRRSKGRKRGQRRRRWMGT
jgi:hypothetical protein